MAYKLISSRTEDVSIRRSQDILNKTNTFAGQRPMSPEWSQYLADQMTSGAFTKGNIAFASNGNETQILMNGQHQCQAAVLAGKTFRATVDYYKVENDEDLWMLFGKFDVHRQRSEQNIMRAARGLFTSESLQLIDLRTLQACGSALNWLRDGTKPDFGIKALDKTSKPRLVEQFSGDVLFVKSVCDAAGDNRCGLMVVVACAIIASHRLSSKSFDFWRRVLGGFELARGTAEWQLSKDLSTGAIGKKTRHRGGGGATSRQWNLCASWWNAFMQKEPRRSVKLDSIKGIVTMVGDKK